jgi:MFS transporter, ACS family, hexuronate transporter
MTTKLSNPGNYRWRILALLFIATTINYMDRSIIGVLAPTLQYKVFQWSDNDYARINMAFKLAYAIGLLVMGGIIDRFGTRKGYTISIAIWSFFGMLHAAVRPVFSRIGFMIARFGLGFGEAGNFPSAIKTVAEWFPKKERALATGIFNAGSNVGAILAPLIIPLIVMADGKNWQFAFLTTGFFSAIWVILWLSFYRKPELHPSLSKEELAHINSDSVKELNVKIPWRMLLKVKETWAFAAAKMTDVAWMFYLFWGGKFLFDKFGLNIRELALPLIIIYVLADFGSIFGGWLSSYFLKLGWSVNKARKIALLTCALSILPVIFVTVLPTSFVVNQKLFDNLSRTFYKTKTEVNVKGKVQFQKIEKQFPLETIAILHKLDGKTYYSAKELVSDLRTILAEEDLTRFEAIIIQQSRSNRYYWFAVLLIALAAAGHQAWSANAFTLVSDVFPKKATASVTGIGGMVGMVASLLTDYGLGKILTLNGPSGYFFAFLLAGLIYITMLGVIHTLMPTMHPLGEDLKPVL